MSAGGRHVVDVGAVERFLSGRRIAVVGVGTSASSFGRSIYDALLDHGYEALAVNRSTSLTDVAGPVDGVMIVVKDPSAVLAVIDEAAGLGVARVWLFKGLGGPGALSDAAVDRCRALASTWSRAPARSCSWRRCGAATASTVGSAASVAAWPTPTPTPPPPDAAPPTCLGGVAYQSGSQVHPNGARPGAPQPP